MAKATFDDYLDDLAGCMEAIRAARDLCNALYERHESQDMGGVTDFDGRRMTAAQYAAGITTLINLQTFWDAGNGTNIEAILTDKP